MSSVHDSLDTAVTAFRKDLEASPRSKDVVLMMYSEFGRRVKANASDGTDHGTAGDDFLIGDLVKPGYHGDQPSLTDLDNGDLKATTDFRSIYSEVSSRLLGTDPGQVVDGAPAPLGVFV